MDIQECAMEILQEIVDDTLLTVGQPHDVLAKMVASLVEQLPMEFLNKTESISFVAEKFKNFASDTKLDMKKLVESVESITSVQREEMAIILDQILKDVFGKGVDYLYLIHQ